MRQLIKNADMTGVTDPTAAGGEEKVPTSPAVETAGVTYSIQQAAAGSEDKGTPPPLGEMTGATDSIQQADAESEDKGTPPPPGEMTGATDSIQEAAESENNLPTSSAVVESLRAIGFKLLFFAAAAVVVTLAVPLAFYGEPMSQVWILSLNICFYVFLSLLYMWRSGWFYTEFVRLSYAPLLASHMGSITATFVLFIGMVWAAGNFGYYLAVHRLHEGTELAIKAVPVPSCPTKDNIEDLNFNLHIGVPFLVLLWALVMMLIVNVLSMTDELLILMFLSYFGWIHAAFWVVIVSLELMRGVLLREWMEWLLAALFRWMLISPLICVVSVILSVFCHLLLMMALVAYLWYNIAIYTHLLETAIPSTTTPLNEDTLCNEILGGKNGQMESDHILGETK